MDYLKIYQRLCERGKEERIFYPTWGRIEKHHIIPRHCKGSNHKTNLTALQHKEHILAHHLLYRLYNHIEDKLAYKMMKGVLKDFWKDPEYAQHMRKKVCENLQKVDRGKQREATKLVGQQAVKEKTGIHKEGMREISIRASKEWARRNPELAALRSSLSHKNRTKDDYLRMAHTKAKFLPVSPSGQIYGSVAEAAYLNKLPKYTIDNWTRRNQNGWTRIENTGRA